MSVEVAVFTKNSQIHEALNKVGSPHGFTFLDNPKFDDYLGNHFIVCDVESLLAKKGAFLKVKKQNLYLVSALTDDENMGLIQQFQLQHLVGLNEATFASEIVNHLRKAVEKKIWGLRTYFEEDSDIQYFSLSDSKNTNEMIEEALKHFDFNDYFSSPVQYIQVMANELISNSLYKGPNRKRSELGLDSVDRKSPVFLKGSELVQITIAMDAHGVALSVQDSFGGLDYETLISSLSRSFEEKTVMDKKDGAGLGLYLTYLHSNQFIINHRKDFRTEIICIIDKNKRFKNYKQRIRSFHFFQEVPSEKTNN